MRTKGDSIIGRLEDYSGIPIVIILMTSKEGHVSFEIWSPSHFEPGYIYGIYLRVFS